MLELLIGRSGSGKTYRILQSLEAQIDAGEQNILWLVPEQFSFESERLLLNRLGVERAARVKVLSFSRLADMVFRQVGGLTKERLDEGTRALLMSRALEQTAQVSRDLDDPMEGLREKQAADREYMKEILGLWEELKQCSVPTRELEETAQRLEEAGSGEAALTGKLRSLCRVFTVYEGLANASGLDELEVLTQLSQQLPDSTLPQDACIYVDGFKGFTAQEMQVLEQLMVRAGHLTVALTTETPGIRWPGADKAACHREYTLFSPVTDTVEALRRAAQRHGLCWELTELEENRRTASPALQALERGLYAPKPAVYEGEAPEVTVIPCEDEFSECRVAVREIRRLMREEGYRCRDITVVVRDLPTYQGLLNTALQQEGIPCYMDERSDLLCEPLAVYSRSALRIAVGGFRTEEMLRLLKTDLTALTPVQIARLENYVYQWRIEGSSWTKEWTESPAGLDRAMSAADIEQLKQLNAWRRTAVEPLLELRCQLQGRVTGRQFAMSMYTFLTADPALPRRIAAQAEQLEAMAQPVLAAHAARLWDEMMGILDRFNSALGTELCSVSRLEDLFTMLCGLVDMGHIPQGLDAVTVGSADRIRYTNPKAVLILGANEGVFPAYPTGGGLLTEEERDALREEGMELSADLLRRCVEERYFLYTAVAAPSEKLMVLYRTGGDMAPSPLIGALDRILPGHTTRSAFRPDGRDLETGREMLFRLAQSRASSENLAGLREVLEENPAYGSRLDAMDRCAGRLPNRLEDSTVPGRLFGRDMCFSASQTDQFYNCRFAYFCKYGLRLESRQRAEINAHVFGTMVHYVMETLLPVYTRPGGRVDGLKAHLQETGETMLGAEDGRQLMDAIRDDVERTVEEYVVTRMGGRADKSGRFLYQVGLAQRAAANMLWHTLMELVQSDFLPVGFEVDIHPEGEEEDGSVLSLRLPIDGGSVQIRGRVDRVDLFVRFDGSAFVRVVDYKTGTKDFSLKELTAGLNMQMLIYLFILCENGRTLLEQTDTLHPAGVLYHPLSDLTVDRGKDDADRLRSMQMSGLVLADPSVLLAMEPLGGKCFVPATLDKGGKPKGSVATPHQFALLRGVIEQLLTAMAEKLQKGDIAAYPMQNGNKLTCEYCDYRSVCRREETDPIHQLGNDEEKQRLEDYKNAEKEEKDRG